MHPLINQTCASKDWTIDGNEITVQLDSGRHQVVIVEQYEAKGLAFIRMYSHLGAAADVDERRLRAALRLNWTLPYGAVAIASIGEDSEHLVLVDSALVENLTEGRLGMAIEYLATTADNYEKFVFGTDDY